MPKRATLSFMSALAVVAMALCGAQAASATTETFDYTGSSQTWTVPAGVTSATFDLYGAAGYSGSPLSMFAGGKGGRATATLSVAPGDQIEINVGGAGAADLGVGIPGFNGGGGGRFPGGGATDVRIGGTALADRVLVAGGGGGPAGCAPDGGSGVGGAGGGLTGGAGVGECSDTVGGTGGTQSAGGSSGGSLGQGGSAPLPFQRGGGGGGGYYGGGAGTTTDINGGSGGGGSGYGPQGTVFETGVRDGDGVATVTYTGLYELTVGVSGDGSGRVTSPGGIDCRSGSASPGDCRETVTEGTAITLSATADEGSSFTGWSGGGCNGTAGTCVVSVDSAKTVVARFTKDPPDAPPVITGMKVVPRSFAPDPAPMQPRRRGAQIELSLNEQASIRFRVRSNPVGRSSRPGARPRVFTRSLSEGPSSIPFTGTFRRKLKSGRYRVIAIATDSAGQRSDKKRAKFRVKG